MAQNQSGSSAGRRTGPFNFPGGYGDHKIVLLARDPWWVFTYWEIRKEKEDEAVRRIEKAGEARGKSILRVYDVTDIRFNGNNAHSFFDIELKGLASTWYVHVNSPGRAWIVDIGILSGKGNFYLLARSNVVKTPRFGMSEELDAEWMAPEDEFRRMFGLSGGMGIGKGSLEMREMFKKRLEEAVTSGVSSGASFYRRPSERKFWLVVNTELIVYGATEPDAKLTVQGKDIKLREDGTFTLRFTLPDGTQAIPVEAVSADGVDKRRIKPVVTRKTE